MCDAALVAGGTQGLNLIDNEIASDDAERLRRALPDVTLRISDRDRVERQYLQLAVQVIVI